MGIISLVCLHRVPLSVVKASSIVLNHISFVGDFSFMASVRSRAIENPGIKVSVTSPNKILVVDFLLVFLFFIC